MDSTDSTDSAVSDLHHADCLELVRGTGERHTARVAVDGASPLLLACFVRAGGDVLVPTGTDASLTRAATGKPVAVEFSGEETGQGWTVRGVGLARPLGHRDRPRPAAGDALALRYAFDNGIRIRIARLTGSRTGPAIPAQRSAEAPAPDPVPSEPETA